MNKPSLDQIKKGIEVEMEHTSDKKEALKIALDHLSEDPMYYDKLSKAGLEENPQPEPKYSIGDQVKWENQDWTVQLISNKQYKLKHSKGLPSTFVSIGVLDSRTKTDDIKEEEMINCKACKHKWKASEGGEDKYICHKCQSDNTPVDALHEGEFCPQCLIEYILENRNTLNEAKYQGRTVQLGKPMAGDVKKFKVYVKNNKGNVVKVNFGQKGVKIKKNNPARRKSFRARHHCDTNPGPRWKARYWSCRKW